MDRIIKTEVKTYKVKMLCSECDGTMTPTGRSFLTYPEKYEHMCNKCGYKENFTENYPTIKYE